jgi:hypothetical protein
MAPLTESTTPTPHHPTSHPTTNHSASNYANYTWSWHPLSTHTLDLKHPSYACPLSAINHFISPICNTAAKPPRLPKSAPTRTTQACLRTHKPLHLSPPALPSSIQPPSNLRPSSTVTLSPSTTRRPSLVTQAKHSLPRPCAAHPTTALRRRFSSRTATAPPLRSVANHAHHASTLVYGQAHTKLLGVSPPCRSPAAHCNCQALGV